MAFVSAAAAVIIFVVVVGYKIKEKQHEQIITH